MKKIPVNIISGFLGSGKTTAIIRLLSQKSSDESWAIVVNEFGKVSIDGLTIQSKTAAGSVFEISGGCICCSAKLYLKENLEKIIETGKFRRIIIEPSGLGGIELVSEMVESIPELEIMPIICLVDITNFENPRLNRNWIFQSQINKAERIVFSKCDLLPSKRFLDEALIKFKALFPSKYTCFVGTSLSTPLLLPLEACLQEKQKKLEAYNPVNYLIDAAYCEHTIQLNTDYVFCTDKLSKILDADPSIIRAKGHIHTEKGWILFNYSLSGTNFESGLLNPISELVIIGWKSKFDFSAFEKRLYSLNVILYQPII